MSELSAAQLTELRGLLLELKSEIETSLQDSADSSKTVDLDQPIGRLSRMDALQQQAMASAGQLGLKKRLQLVESALQSFHSERYGECRRCEEPIGFSRLQVSPEAPFCLCCQEAMEKQR